MKKLFKIKDNKLFYRVKSGKYIHLETLPMSDKTLLDLLDEAFLMGQENIENKILDFTEKL